MSPWLVLAEPESSWERCHGCTTCYHGNRRDVLLNNAVLVLTVGALAVGAVLQHGEPLLDRLLFLSFALLSGSVQMYVALAADTEGFSIVWAALLGFLVHAHAAFALYTLDPSEPHVASYSLSGLAAGVGIVALLYYSASTHYLSTLAHLISAAIGFGVGALGRAHALATSVILLGLAAAAAVAALARRVRSSGAEKARLATAPGAQPATTLTSGEMALALLQEQLLRTRDELARAEHQLGVLERQEELGDKAAASGATCAEAAGVATDTSDEAAGGEAEGAERSVQSLRDRLAMLRRREETLARRASEKAILLTAAETGVSRQQGVAPAPAPGAPCATAKQAENLARAPNAARVSISPRCTAWAGSGGGGAGAPVAAAVALGAAHRVYTPRGRTVVRV